ncbi:MAG: 4-hydroxy-tetrahydrodipicolinate synthase, partial [Endomicrobiia bacterium]
MFKGSIVALVTPFKNGELDKEKLRELVEWHIANKTDGILPCGTTGESPTLSYEEHNEVIKIVVEQVRGRVPVIGGTGSNSTRETLELSQYAKDVGCDGILLVVPYYNKPTQNGLYEHYKIVAEKIDIPIIVYNIPGRTGVNLEPSTFVKICKTSKNFVGIKEASGSIEQVSQIYNGLKEENLEDRVYILSGDDSMTYPMMTLGGKGVISVLANILPVKTHLLTELALKGDFVEARELHYELYELMKSLFIETNPIPVKFAMEMMGLCSSEVRSPMSKMSKQNEEKLL